jgi:aspartate kinase
MATLVKKFGGSSVATPEKMHGIVDRILRERQPDDRIVLVVSAMGDHTDDLLTLAAKVNPEMPKRELDMLLATGEQVSIALMASAFCAKGQPAVSFTGAQAGIKTNDKHSKASILDVQACQVKQALDEGKIVIVAGFQGITDLGQITTLGRGGSDTTAAAIGAALHAECVEIYTDVEGIMTADPRLVKEASILKQISYGEVCQMAHQGAKVIHPRAVEIAMKKNIPLIVKSTFSDAPGTLITNDCAETEEDTSINERRLASGVTHLTDLAQFRVALNPEDIASGRKLFEDLADAGISVGCLNLSESNAMFAVFADDVEHTNKVLNGTDFEYTLTEDCAKVSVVGSAMRGVPGVMANFVAALTGCKISILQTVDSDTTISAIIKQEHLIDAVKALHKAFKL